MFMWLLVDKKSQAWQGDPTVSHSDTPSTITHCTNTNHPNTTIMNHTSPKRQMTHQNMAQPNRQPQNNKQDQPRSSEILSVWSLILEQLPFFQWKVSQQSTQKQLQIHIKSPWGVTHWFSPLTRAIWTTHGSGICSTGAHIIHRPSHPLADLRVTLATLSLVSFESCCKNLWSTAGLRSASKFQIPSAASAKTEALKLSR